MISIPSEIRDKLNQDTCPKNIRIHFPNGERSDICNDLIVMNSVNLKESICSQNTFRLGLIESPIFECEVVGVGNIEGATIEVSCEVFWDDPIRAIWKTDIQHYVHPIPLGTFVVDKAERQADMIHRKLICYNKIIGTSGLTLNDAELWKANITKFLGQYYELSLLDVLNCMVDGNLSIWNYRYRDEGYLIRDSIIDTYTQDGTYNFPDTGILPCTFTIKVTSDIYRFGEADNVFGYNVNDYHYISKIFLSGTNENFQQEYIDYCNGKTGRCVYMPVIPSVTKTKLVKGDHYTYGKTLYLAKDDFDDFQIYPYVNDWYDSYVEYKQVLQVTVAKRIDIYTDHDLSHPVKSILVCSNSIGKYYVQPSYEFPDTMYLKYRVPIIDDSEDVGWRIDFSSIDINEVVNAFLETNVSMGRLTRDNGLEILNVRHLFDLRPDENLYPSPTLYPQGSVGGSILPQDYQSCWYEDEYRKPYGKLIVHYLQDGTGSLEPPESIYETYINGFSALDDENSYLTYVFDNAIYKSHPFYVNQIAERCAWYANFFKNIIYMPVKLVGRGLPYVQPGDTFEIKTRSNDSITTIVLSRTLKGEMVLTDEYVSVT